MPLECEILHGNLERKTKYTRKWTRRFCKFDATSRYLSYANAEHESGPPKRTMLVNKMTRLSELVETDAFQLTTLLFDGPLVPNLSAATAAGDVVPHADDAQKSVQWAFRIPDRATFEVWYQWIRRSLAAAGFMSPLNGGLPASDPRHQLPYATVPLEHLFHFSRLEDAVMYSFLEVRCFDACAAAILGDDHNTMCGGVAIVGENAVHIFRSNATTICSFPITFVKTIRCSHGHQQQVDASRFCVLQLHAPEPDIVFECRSGLDGFVNALTVRHRMLSHGQHVLTCSNLPMDEKKATLTDLVACGKFRTKVERGFSWKRGGAALTSKAHLKKLLAKQMVRNSVEVTDALDDDGIAMQPTAIHLLTFAAAKDSSKGKVGGPASPLDNSTSMDVCSNGNGISLTSSQEPHENHRKGFDSSSSSSSAPISSSRSVVDIDDDDL